MGRPRTDTDWQNVEMKTRVGTILWRARRRAQKTQREASEVVGAESPQTILNWEQGHCLPSVNDVRILAKLYGFDPKDFAEVVADAIAKQQRIAWLLGAKTNRLRKRRLRKRGR